MVLLATLYALGWAVHLYSQAKASVMSNSNGLKNTWQWLRMNSHIILVRMVLGTASFLLWIETPQLFGELVGRAVPMTKGTVIIIGFCVDAFWDKTTFIGGLKVEVPHLSPPDTTRTQ